MAQAEQSAVELALTLIGIKQRVFKALMTEGPG
jgi:hypothetical protein